MGATASFRTLDDWLQWLQSLSPREIVLGLDRVHAVLEKLDLARPELVITVAGTNGKGSCLAMLESILRKAGRRTGAYSSPHVHRYNERTRIDGEPATDAVVMQALRAVETARVDVPLTFFEFGTLATLVAFDQARVDTWLLEVGMGGRLDAVNAVDADACLITNVALDHCSWLGNDVETIAVEKAGVMRRGRPAVFGSPTVPESIRRAADKTGADLACAGSDFDFEVGTGGRWSWRGKAHALPDLPPPGLPGVIQYQNAAAVLAVLEALGLDDILRSPLLSNALADARLPGRCQRVGDRWLLDVAHNPAASATLASELVSQFAGREVTAVIGMLEDKDIEGFIAPLNALVSRFIAVSITERRGSSAAEIARRIANSSGRPCQVCPELDAALARADASCGAEGIVLVTGSFYLVGPALTWLDRVSGRRQAVAAAD